MNNDRMVLIRPPSEAGSLLLPVTLGCSNNTCTFCGTYDSMPFRVRRLEDILADIDEIARHYFFSVTRVFLENGDALIAPQHILKPVLERLKAGFPKLERVGTYSTPRAANLKNDAELIALKEMGLTIAYLGVESGDETVLRETKKGATYDEIVTAGRKLKKAGITLSVTVILGLGGVARSREHALATAKILTDLDPDYAGALVLTLGSDTPLKKDLEEGRFQQITPMQTIEELKTIIKNSSFTDCFFTSNHASNYLPLRVCLPEQKADALALLTEIIEKNQQEKLRPSLYRRLGVM